MSSPAKRHADLLRLARLAKRVRGDDALELLAAIVKADALRAKYGKGRRMDGTDYW